MTNDETQRKMDFIVNQQAQFSADIELLKELQRKTDDILTRIAGATLTLTQRMVELSAAQAHMDGKMANLAESHQNLAENHQTIAESHQTIAESHQTIAESHARLLQSQTQLAESQEHTDQRLNALIDIVRDNQNGRN